MTVAPNPRDREAQAYARALEDKRERVRLSEGRVTTTGVPLTADERAWLLVYMQATKAMSDTGRANPRRGWWRGARA